MRQVRIFVNQLYGPAHLSAGGKPDSRSDLLAIRFASFNPILDPWVYILCRKNLLLKGCKKLKKAVARVQEGRSDDIGWVGGQHSPPSLNSNDTSYASLRRVSDRTDAEPRGSVHKASFTDFALRQAWDYDASRVIFHPFSVESTAICDEEAAAPKRDGTTGKVSPRGSATPVLSAHVRGRDVVTCTFSTPTSGQSVKYL